MTNKDQIPYALDLTENEWRQWFVSRGAPSFTAVQVLQWIFQRGIFDPLSFSNIALSVREQLRDSFVWDLPSIDSCLTSQDGSIKFLLKTFDNNLIEMVLMPYKNRTTVCVSSQIGCRMGCRFCQTAKLGFKRNLSQGEILAQVILANRYLQDHALGKAITNVVFMGMGEPLDNYASVVSSCRFLIDSKYFGLSKNRVTISTAGLISGIQKLGQDLPVRLAISLHATQDDQRSKLMPINRKNDLKALRDVLKHYPASERYGITFEYIMIKGVNDSIADAKRLVKFLHGIKAKVNLIPINCSPGMKLKPSDEQALKQFQKYLSERSIPAPIRYSRGQDVSGGCGQLAAKHNTLS